MCLCAVRKVTARLWATSGLPNGTVRASVAAWLPAGTCGAAKCGRPATGGVEVRRVAMGEAVMTTRRQADGAIVVDVRGSLDAATVDALRDTLLGTLQRERPVTLIVDLTFVTFMDSLGIGALVTGYNAAREMGTRFVLRHAERVRPPAAAGDRPGRDVQGLAGLVVLVVVSPRTVDL